MKKKMVYIPSENNFFPTGIVCLSYRDGCGWYGILSGSDPKNHAISMKIKNKTKWFDENTIVVTNRSPSDLV